MKKLKWIAPISLLVLALVFGAVWLILGRQMTQQADQGINAALAKAGMEGKLQWGSLDVSPLGTVVMDNLRLQLPGEDVFKARQVRISDVINQSDRQRIHLRLIEAGMDFSAQTKNQFPADVPQAFFNPADMNLQVDFNFKSNQGELVYASWQEGMGDFSLHLNLSQIAALRGMLRALLPDLALADEASADDLDPGLIGLNRVAALYALSLDALDIKLSDRGVVKLLMQMAQKNMPAYALKNGQSAEQAFAENMQEFKAACASAEEALQQPCQTLYRFVVGEKDSLHLSAKPAQPVSLEQLERTAQAPRQGAGGLPVAPLMQLLNVNLK